MVIEDNGEKSLNEIWGRRQGFLEKVTSITSTAFQQYSYSKKALNLFGKQKPLHGFVSKY